MLSGRVACGAEPCPGRNLGVPVSPAFLHLWPRGGRLSVCVGCRAAPPGAPGARASLSPPSSLQEALPKRGAGSGPQVSPGGRAAVRWRLAGRPVLAHNDVEPCESRIRIKGHVCTQKAESVVWGAVGRVGPPGDKPADPVQRTSSTRRGRPHGSLGSPLRGSQRGDVGPAGPEAQSASGARGPRRRCQTPSWAEPPVPCSRLGTGRLLPGPRTQPRRPHCP